MDYNAIIRGKIEEVREKEKELKSLQDGLRDSLVQLFRERECNAFLFTPEHKCIMDGVHSMEVVYPTISHLDDEYGGVAVVGVRLSRSGKFGFIYMDMEWVDIPESIDFVRFGHLPEGFIQIGNEWLDSHDLEIADAIPNFPQPMDLLVDTLLEAPASTLMTFPQQDLFNQ